MKLLITGGAGFIGSAVIRHAIGLGHSVVNLDCLTYAGNLENVALVESSPFYVFERADIRDGNALRRILDEHHPDAVIHLAAESHVDRSIDCPADFVTTNVNGTYELLAAVRSYWSSMDQPSNFRFQHISTDEVYGEFRGTGSLTEETRYAPSSPYSASKAASDHLVSAWHVTYELPVLLVHCSNNYGPYQFPEKLIPLVILKALAGEPIPVYGKGANLRDWLHVDDLADALLKVLSKGRIGRTYNISGGNEVCNLDLVQKLCEILDTKFPGSSPYADQITFVADRPGHDFRYGLDSTRMRTELSWEPSISLDDGLQGTVEWYLQNEEWWRPLSDRNEKG